jgi:hypothetical protein
LWPDTDISEEHTACIFRVGVCFTEVVHRTQGEG